MRNAASSVEVVITLTARFAPARFTSASSILTWFSTVAVLRKKQVVHPSGLSGSPEATGSRERNSQLVL